MGKCQRSNIRKSVRPDNNKDKEKILLYREERRTLQQVLYKRLGIRITFSKH